MNTLRFFLVILFFVALFVIYVSSTNTISQNSESSLVDVNTEKEFVIDTNKNTIQTNKFEDNQENRQQISSYEQKTNHSYEQKSQETKNLEEKQVKLEPYNPEIFDSLQGSSL